MSTDVDAGDMEKINVRVPRELLEEIDERYEERGYANRSEAIRDALRDWVNPPVQISDEFAEYLKESQEQAERGEWTALEDLE